MTTVEEPRAKTSYLDKTVLEAALERIHWVYDNHEHVGVNYSGGKDSTVVLHLTLQVARERGRLPVDVLFVDQEAEWQATVEHMREIKNVEGVNLHWLQMPIRISNANSPYVQWLQCWEEGATWMREKEPDSEHENIYGTQTFKDVFSAWQKVHHPGVPAGQIAGVRTEESPSRRMGLTTYETWRGQTWGSKVKNTEHFTWYPIYDWRLQDVWKFIHERGLAYCSLYDSLYQHGVPPRSMRLSSLHHEGAINTLFMLQELEPDTWDALSARMAGVNTAGQLNWAAFRVKELPPMFRSWEEYRDHLLENLVPDEEQREKMRKHFLSADRRYWHDEAVYRELLRTEIKVILCGDDHRTKLTVFEAGHMGKSKNSGKRSTRVKA